MNRVGDRKQSPDLSCEKEKEMRSDLQREAEEEDEEEEEEKVCMRKSRGLGEW